MADSKLLSGVIYDIEPREDGHYTNVLDVKGSPLTVRRAVLADHDRILEMDVSGGAYDRGDYLHGTLKIYLNDPDRLAYIGELQGKVVGFLLQRKTDGGYNIHGRMARVDKAFRGAGVWEAVRYVGTLDSSHFWPNVHMYFGCTSSPEIPFFSSSSHWKLVMGRPYLTIRLSKSERIATPKCDVKCSPLLRSECEEILENPSLSHQLFPRGMLVIGREPFMVHPINFDGIAKEYDTIQASYSSDPTPAHLSCMSFGTGVRGQNTTYIYDCAIYSCSGKREEFAHHLHTHLPIAQELSPEEDIAFNLFGQSAEESDNLMAAVHDLRRGDGDLFVNENTRVSVHALMCITLRDYYEVCKQTFFQVKGKFQKQSDIETSKLYNHALYICYISMMISRMSITYLV